jgi:hypothetical protein
MLGLQLTAPADRPLSVLAIGAHPDDIEIGAGGTLLSLAGTQPGLRARYVVLTGTGDRRIEARNQALYPFGHSAGRLGAGRQGLDTRRPRRRLPPGQIVVVGRFVAAAQCLVGEPGGHVPHDARGLQFAHRRDSPRAGQVVQGGERAAVGQPRRRLRDVGEAARAAMGDSEEPARRAAELGGDDRRVPGRDHCVSLTGAGSRRPVPPTATASRTRARAPAAGAGCR